MFQVFLGLFHTVPDYYEKHKRNGRKDGGKNGIFDLTPHFSEIEILEIVLNIVPEAKHNVQNHYNNLKHQLEFHFLYDRNISFVVFRFRYFRPFLE